MSKKYYIAVDCEGVACAVGLSGIGLSDCENYRFACRQATREANAAAKALFDSGADEVTVWDAHGSGINLDYDEIDSRCHILLGAGHKGRFVGIDESFTAVLFIGYHAMAGTENAVLAHTFSSKAFQYYKLNGKMAGELAIDAAYAGEKGVPVLFCSSDDKGVSEAKALFGEIATVETKKSLSWTSAISKQPLAICQEIYDSVLAAAKTGAISPPFRLPSPLDVEIRFQRQDSASSAALFDFEGKPFSFIDSYTRSGRVSSVTDLF